MRSTVLLSAFAALAAAHGADDLDLAYLRNLRVPTYSIAEGVESQVSTYNEATAVASASLALKVDPLTVFPAAPTIALNRLGESQLGKRDVVSKRAACEAEPTMPNLYNVSVSTYESFKSDATIARIANSAVTPLGYQNNFKNLQASASAFAYLGFSVIVTGYDTERCAALCTQMSGCLAFNIFFQRDPVVEPGPGCENPAAFPNVKCSFWGSGLEAATATNEGSTREQFQVGIAGSNAYTTYSFGGPVAGYSAPDNLNTSVINAPLFDCAGTFTYLGYKIFQDGPFDGSLCGAACDSQTAYNAAYPPSTGSPAVCAAFGAYVLTLTNSTGSFVLGQVCTLYTSDWNETYATNNAAYDDGIGAKYTYSFSFFYSKPSAQPDCSTPNPPNSTISSTIPSSTISSVTSSTSANTTISSTIPSTSANTTTSSVIPSTSANTTISLPPVTSLPPTNTTISLPPVTSLPSSNNTISLPPVTTLPPINTTISLPPVTTLPPVNTTIVIPPSNTTIVIPPINTTIPIPSANTTISLPPVTTLPPTNTTIPVPPINTTISLPPINTTISLPPVTTLPPTNTSIPLPPVNTTISLPPVTTLPPVNTTIPLPPLNTTIPLPPVNTTIPLPSGNTTIVIPSSNITVSLPFPTSVTFSTSNTTIPFPTGNVTLPSLPSLPTSFPIPTNGTTLLPGNTTISLPGGSVTEVPIPEGPITITLTIFPTPSITPGQTGLPTGGVTTF